MRSERRWLNPLISASAGGGGGCRWLAKGKERAMKLTSLHTLPREIHSVGHLVWAGEYVSYRPRLGHAGCTAVRHIWCNFRLL